MLAQPRISRRRSWLNGPGGCGRSADSGRTSNTSAVPVRGSIRLIGSAGQLGMPCVLLVRGRPWPSDHSVFGVHSHGSHGQSLVPLLCRGSCAQPDECRVATMSGGGCAMLCPLRSFLSRSHRWQLASGAGSALTVAAARLASGAILPGDVSTFVHSVLLASSPLRFTASRYESSARDTGGRIRNRDR